MLRQLEKRRPDREVGARSALGRSRPSDGQTEGPQATPSADPVAPARLFGRERALAQLDELVEDHDARIVTLTGLTGVGKTALAELWVERLIAASPHRSPRRVLHVALSSARTRAELARRWAAALVPTGSRGARSRASAELDAAFAAHPASVVFFDDADQVLDALRERVKAIVAQRKDVLVIVTSRAPVGIRGEHVFRVVPPDHAAAVDLFLACAGRAGVRLAHTAAEREQAGAIVALLDRMPLALELAAAQARVLSLESLRHELARGRHLVLGGRRDDAEHHQSLDHALRWTLSSLSASERAILGALTVFEGSFGIEAAEFVLEGEATRTSVATTVQALWDRSLLRFVTPPPSSDGRRYQIPRPFRPALEACLTPPPVVAERHARWFIALGRRLGAAVTAGAPEALDELLSEHDNILAARRFTSARCPHAPVCDCRAHAIDVQRSVLEPVACARIDPDGFCPRAQLPAAAVRNGTAGPPPCRAESAAASPCSTVRCAMRLARELDTLSPPAAACPWTPATKVRTAPPPEVAVVPPPRRAPAPAPRPVPPPAEPTADAASPSLEVAADGTRFRWAGGPEVSLADHPVLAELLRLLTEARVASADGGAVPSAHLVAHIWAPRGGPDRSGPGRLYVAINRLRALGLGSHLRRVYRGYALDAVVTIAREAAASS